MKPLFSNLPLLETERLLLRSVRDEDANDVFKFTSNPLTSEWLTWYPHKSIDDTMNFITSVLQNYRNNQAGQWAIELKITNQVIGLCGFIYYSEEHFMGEVAYVVSPDFWGRGFLPEALRKIVDHSFIYYGTKKIIAKCENGNIGSEKALLKADFKQEDFLISHFERKGIRRDYKFFAIVNESK
jgi:ribosomal-protein-alanine N-acetyltransferase